MCRNEVIKELLPAYLERRLEGGDLTSVEAHLASCPDCSGELELLRTLASEPVPDPGELFWDSFPGRVAREVRREAGRERPVRRAWRLLAAPFPRWAWATAALLIAAVAVWYAAAPQGRAPGSMFARKGAVPRERVVESPAGLAKVHPKDIDRLSAWAHRELLAAQKDLMEPLPGISPVDLGIEEDLVALDQEQLDELIEKLRQNDEEG